MSSHLKSNGLETPDDRQRGHFLVQTVKMIRVGPVHLENTLAVLARLQLRISYPLFPSVQSMTATASGASTSSPGLFNNNFRTAARLAAPHGPA